MNKSSRLHRLWLFRPGRRRQFLVWISLGGLALSVAVLGLAAAANARVPALGWKLVSTLPEKPSPVQTLVWDPSTAVLYVGTAGGVFRSRDGGESWQSAGAGLTDRVETLAVDEASSTVYAGTWDGVFRSVAGGERWLRAGETLRGKRVVALTVDAAGKRGMPGPRTAKSLGQPWKRPSGAWLGILRVRPAV